MSEKNINSVIFLNRWVWDKFCNFHNTSVIISCKLRYTSSQPVTRAKTQSTGSTAPCIVIPVSLPNSLPLVGVGDSQKPPARFAPFCNSMPLWRCMCVTGKTRIFLLRATAYSFFVVVPSASVDGGFCFSTKEEKKVVVLLWRGCGKRFWYPRGERHEPVAVVRGRCPDRAGPGAVVVVVVVGGGRIN